MVIITDFYENHFELVISKNNITLNGEKTEIHVFIQKRFELIIRWQQNWQKDRDIYTKLFWADNTV